MAKRLYHPGRRKRRLIMHERAFAVVFDINPDDRNVKFPAKLRDLLEALVDVDAAYDGKANMDCCIVAGEKALDCSTTVVTAKIAELKLMGLVRFTSFSGGKRLVVENKILLALARLEKLALMIDVITRIEDRGAPMCDDMLADLETLKEDGIYIGLSDEQLDSAMRNVVEPVVAERQADRRAKREARMNTLKSEEHGMSKLSLALAAVPLALSILAGSADASSADRGGTVGLTLVYSQEK